jgi:hypothetical protein
MIKHKFDIHVIGKVVGPAKRFSSNAPYKFGVYIYGGKDKQTGDYLPNKIINVTCFGDAAKDLKKGDDVELLARWSQNKGKDGKLYEEFVVKTDDTTKQALLNYPGVASGTKHVEDAEIAAGRGRTIQRKENSLEITDEDIPF